MVEYYVTIKKDTLQGLGCHYHQVTSLGEKQDAEQCIQCMKAAGRVLHTYA